MADGSTFSAPVHDLAPGWDAEDLRVLGRLVELSMGLAEDIAAEVAERRAAVKAGDAEPMSAQETSKATLDFTRVARCVRMSLTLRATARGAHSKTVWRGAAAKPEDLLFDPDPDDPNALTDLGLKERTAAEVRICFENVIMDPAGIDLSLPEHEVLAKRMSLRAGLEACIEREAERETFRFGPDPAMIKRICHELGLAWRYTLLRDSTGEPQAWVIARPSEPDDQDVFWQGRGPYYREFLEAWDRPLPIRPPDVDPDPP